MGTLVLLNDISTEVDEAGFLVGDSDPPVSALGKQQAEKISSALFNKVDVGVLVGTAVGAETGVAVDPPPQAARSTVPRPKITRSRW